MISSINDSRAYKSATQGLASTEIRAVENRSRMARNAGTDITASPTQLVARTRMFENSKEQYSLRILPGTEPRTLVRVSRRKLPYKKPTKSRARTLDTLKRVETTTHGYYRKNKPKALYLHLPSTKGRERLNGSCYRIPARDLFRLGARLRQLHTTLRFHHGRHLPGP